MRLALLLALASAVAAPAAPPPNPAADPVGQPPACLQASAIAEAQRNDLAWKLIQLSQMNANAEAQIAADRGQIAELERELAAAHPTAAPAAAK
jgi:hypothetical protein